MTCLLSEKPEPDWQLAAMSGAERASVRADANAELLAALALIGFGLTPSDEEIIEGMRRARGVSAELGVPDPWMQLPVAAAGLVRIGLCDEPDDVAGRILSALNASEVADERMNVG